MTELEAIIRWWWWAVCVLGGRWPPAGPSGSKRCSSRYWGGGGDTALASIFRRVSAGLFPPHLTDTQRPRWGQPQCRLARHSSIIKICLFDNVTPDNQFTRTSTASGNLNHRQRWTGPPLALSQAITPKLKTSRRQFHDGASIFPAFAGWCDVTFSQGSCCRQYKWLMNEIWISRHRTV